MSSDSEQSVLDKALSEKTEATGCFDEALDLDLEGIDRGVDQIVKEEQIDEDNGVFKQIQVNDRQESTVAQDYYHNDHDIIDSSKVDQSIDKDIQVQSSEINSVHNNLAGNDAMLFEIDNISNVSEIVSSDHSFDVNTSLIEKSKFPNQEKSSLIMENSIDLNDNKLLEEISKNLMNRDLVMYDRTFLGVDAEASRKNNNENVGDVSEIPEDNQQNTILEKVQVNENISDHKFLDVNLKESIENELGSNVSEIYEDNQQNAILEKVEVNGNISDRTILDVNLQESPENEIASNVSEISENNRYQENAILDNIVGNENISDHKFLNIDLKESTENEIAGNISKISEDNEENMIVDSTEVNENICDNIFLGVDLKESTENESTSNISKISEDNQENTTVESFQVNENICDHTFLNVDLKESTENEIAGNISKISEDNQENMIVDSIEVNKNICDNIFLSVDLKESMKNEVAGNVPKIFEDNQQYTITHKFEVNENISKHTLLGADLKESTANQIASNVSEIFEDNQQNKVMNKVEGIENIPDDCLFLNIDLKTSTNNDTKIAGNDFQVSENNHLQTVNIVEDLKEIQKVSDTDKDLKEIESISNTDTKLKEILNISGTNQDSKEIQNISNTHDPKSLAINQLKITENIKVLKIEKSNDSKNSDKGSLLTNLIKKNTENLSTTEKIAIGPLIKNVSNTSESGALLKQKNTEEPNNLIQKLQSMDWLKQHSANESMMGRHRKTTWKKQSDLPDCFEGEEKNNKEKERNVDQSNSSVAAQPNIWKTKSAVEQLFPDVQLANRREDEEMNKAIIDSICTAQQESEKRKMAVTFKNETLNYEDNNEWGKKNYENLPAEPLPLLGSHAKGLTDQYGRVDGYSERRPFMGVGARRKEQLLNAQLENSNSQSAKNETLPNQSQQASTNNTRSQTTQSQSSKASKQDASLQSKTQQGSSSQQETPQNDASLSNKSNQNSSKRGRRGSNPKVEPKSDLRITEKSRPNFQNETKETKEKSELDKENSKDSQQQKGQITNQEIEIEIKQQNIKIDERIQAAMQEVKMEPRGQNQRSACLRGEEMPKDKPGFNQASVKDSHTSLDNLDLTAKPSINFNRSQNYQNQQSSNLNRCNRPDNRNQDNYNRQSHSDRYGNKSIDLFSRNQDKEQPHRTQNFDNYNTNQNQDRSLRNSGQDYINRNQNQDYFNNRNQAQDRSGRNQTQDQFDRHQNQDSNRNRGQDRVNRNQSQDSSNKNQCLNQFYKSPNHQDQNRNQSSYGRFHEQSNRNQNASDKNHITNVDSHDHYQRNQTYDRYNLDQDRYSKNKDFGKEYQDSTNRNHDQFQKAHSVDKRNDCENSKSKLTSQGDKYNESRNRDQDRHNRYPDSVNKCQNNGNRIQDKFQTTRTEDSWDDCGNAKSMPSFQKTSDNKSQQQSVGLYNQKDYYNQESSNSKNYVQYQSINLQENKKVSDKQMEVPKQTHTNSENQNINTILTRNSTASDNQLNNSISSLVSNLGEKKYHSTQNTSVPLSTSKEIKKDYKEEIPKAETVVTFSHVHESLPSEPRPNVVLAFEGNQNVQRALGLDIHANHTIQPVNSTQLINAAYTNSMMNVNALPFEASSLNAQPGLSCPLVDPSMSILSFPFSANIGNVDSPQRMNEISNLSQDILRLHSTVASLAKQLATAQAELLAAQAKFNQYQQQETIQSDTGTNTSIQTENLPLAPNFYTMQCVAPPPGFVTATPTIQKLQSDAYPLPKNYLASNLQQDFLGDNVHSNILSQRLMQPYLYPQQQQHQQQQETASFQQYSVNVSANVSSTGGASRVRTVPQSQSQLQLIKGRELRGSGNHQFHN